MVSRKKEITFIVVVAIVTAIEIIVGLYPGSKLLVPAMILGTMLLVVYAVSAYTMKGYSLWKKGIIWIGLFLSVLGFFGLYIGSKKVTGLGVVADMTAWYYLFYQAVINFIEDKKSVL